jgi:hypothetical protein
MSSRVDVEVRALKRISVTQYVHAAMFVQDFYHVLCHENQLCLWAEGRWVPRRFCLYNLATREWKHVKHPFNTGRERIEEL